MLHDGIIVERKQKLIDDPDKQIIISLVKILISVVYGMFISKKSKVLTNFLSEYTVILGSTIVGKNTILDANVILGYPTRENIRMHLKAGYESFHSFLDQISHGCRVGSNCHIRSGTVIYEMSSLGDNVETGHNVLIREHTIIGSNVIVGTHTIIEGYVRIGNNVRIESGVFIPLYTTIGNNVFLGPYIVITNDKYPPSKRMTGVTIEDNVVIGANATIMAGVTIGENAVVAAGSVVTKDVPPDTVVAGVPARKMYNGEEYEKRKKEMGKLRMNSNREKQSKTT